MDPLPKQTVVKAQATMTESYEPEKPLLADAETMTSEAYTGTGKIKTPVALPYELNKMTSLHLYLLIKLMGEIDALSI